MGRSEWSHLSVRLAIPITNLGLFIWTQSPQNHLSGVTVLKSNGEMTYISAIAGIECIREETFHSGTELEKMHPPCGNGTKIKSE